MCNRTVHSRHFPPLSITLQILSDRRIRFGRQGCLQELFQGFRCLLLAERVGARAHPTCAIATLLCALLAFISGGITFCTAHDTCKLCLVAWCMLGVCF